MASNAAGDHCRPQWASSSRAPREPGVLHRDRPLPGDDDDAVRVGAHSPGGREPAAQHLTESGVAPRVAVAEVGRCVGDAVADVFVEQADRDVLREVTSGDQNKARDVVTEATRAIAGII